MFRQSCCHVLTVLTLACASAAAQSAGDTQKPQDEAGLKRVLKDEAVPSSWHYDDLASGLARARETGKPLLVTIRCVPCEACSGMDSEVVNPTDAELKNLIGQFVAVRLVQVWDIDLSLLQYDMNMSWAAFFMNADRVIYGRYGTRAAQRDDKAITVPGFIAGLKGALELHRRYESDPVEMSKLLAGKRGEQPRWKLAADNPVIQRTVRWQKSLGKLTGEQNASCVHCHFVPAAEMMGLLSEKEPITDRMLWAYPLPETVGLSLDPRQAATITRVADASTAEQAGIRSGDRIVTMQKQPILSIADVQWVLHQAGDNDTIDVELLRGTDRKRVQLTLNDGWRRRGDFAERASSWDFFKVKLFGVTRLEPLTTAERSRRGIDGATALRVEKMAPAWGGMNSDVRRSGLSEGDIIVAVDGRAQVRSHSELLAYLVQRKKSGDKLELTVLRSGNRRTITVPLNWASRIKALRSP